MKFKIALATLLLSVTAQATPFFKTDSPLPEEIKNRIAAQIQQKCPQVSGVWEMETTEKAVNVDQGIQDLYYSTILSGQVFIGNDPHPNVITIWVNSIQWSVSNPAIDKYEVQPLTSDWDTYCK